MAARMFRFLYIPFLVLALLPVSTGAATDADVIKELAMKCWVKPENVTLDNAFATFEVVYNADGKLVSIKAIEYRPARKAGQEFAASLQRAILECAKEAPVKSRTLRLIIDYKSDQPDGPVILNRSLM